MLALTGRVVAVASAAGPAGVAVSAGMAASAEDVVLQVVMSPSATALAG